MSETAFDESTILFDCEDGVDKRGWVAVEAASTPGEAVAILTRESSELDPHLRYLCDGRKSWHRPNDDPFWQSCEPSDEGAREFWEVELTDVENESP